MTELALFGGDKTKNTPYGKGDKYGADELAEVKEALEQGTLFYNMGNKVKQLTSEFAKMYGVERCVAASSGTAAIHAALGAVGVTAGDEVITSPLTDMGTIIGILYQNAIPVFADLDPHTYNLDPASVESRVTGKTKAILVVHLAGNPADMDAIMDIAKRHSLKVVEDCAQSYMTWYKGRLAGTIGDAGCFSLMEMKHISCGDGGLVLINDESIYHKAQRFTDKGYTREKGQPLLRWVEFLAPNYRMTELQGAVALAQLRKLNWICDKRNAYGDALTEGITGLPGIHPHKITEGGKCSYWFYLMRVDPSLAGVDKDKFSQALEAEGIVNYPGYIGVPIYEYDIFTLKNAYPGTNCPFDCQLNGNCIEYKRGLCPTAEDILDTCIRIPVEEFFTEQDLAETITAIRKVSAYYSSK